MARTDLRYDVPSFIAAYNEGVVAGLTLAEIADLLGLSPATVSQRVNKLVKRGIPMPERKHGNAGRPSPSRGKPRTRSVTRDVQCIPTPAPVPAVLVPRDLCFVITVQ